MKRNRYILLLVLMLFLGSVTAQTVESFRIIKGIPHLPVLASTASVSSPVPGMMIFSHADKTVMVYSGGAWDNFTTTTNVASSSNSKKYFQIINGIPVLPVMSTLTGAVRPGAMYYPSSGGGVRMNNGRGWHAPKQFVLEGEDTEYKQVISGRVNNVDGMIVFPVLASAPKDVEAGAVYITNRFPRMKVFDGTNWLELAVDSYPNTPIPPVKIGNTTWAPVNAGYDNIRLHGLMYQWQRKYGQEYASDNNYPGVVAFATGNNLGNASRFYYTANNPYDWSSTQQALWNMEDYNPCPVGWRVPTQEELTELNQAGSTWVDAGGPDDLPGRWYGGNHSTDRVGSVFFPASGQRSYNVGAVSGRSSNGYYWSSVSSGSNAVSLNIRDAYSNITTGSYRASGYSVRCVKETYSATITSGGNPWFCAGGSVTLTASPGVSYLWSTGETTREITVSYSGDYYVTITFPDGSSQTSASITVTSMPWYDSGILSGNQTVCVGQTTQFSSTKSGGTWSSENMSIASVGPYGEIHGLTPGTTTIRYSITGTCWYPSYRDVTVVALPVLGGAISACEGTTANVTPATGGTWTSSNTAVATVTNGGVVTAKVAGTTTLTYTNTTGCTAQVSFTVKALPIANISTPPDLTVLGCTSESRSFVAADAGAGASYLWSFGADGNPTSSSNRTTSAMWTTPGSKSVTLTVTKDGCSKNTGLTVLVQQTPIVGNMETSICSGETFTVTPADGAGNTIPEGTRYTWPAPNVSGIDGLAAGLNGDILSSISGTLTNTTDAPITVIYNVTPTYNFCSGVPFTVSVTVNPKPVIADVSLSACSGVLVTGDISSISGNVIPVGTTYSTLTCISHLVISGSVSVLDEGIISGLFVNTNSSTASRTCTIVATSPEGCSSSFLISTSVTPSNTVSVGSLSPYTCINTPMATITHTTTGATGIGTPTGLPLGVSASWSSGTITISGTPMQSGSFPYSIPTSGGCGIAYATGTITVRPNNTAGSASSSPTVCVNTAIPNITHNTTGATGIGTATGLPSGVSASWSSNQITISGTPTSVGIYDYSIPLTGGCGTINATGRITVILSNGVSPASANATTCVNTAMATITQTTTGATGISNISGLPPGVSASWSSNRITISGTPTSIGTFDYTILLTGGCGTVYATGRITVTSCGCEFTPAYTIDCNTMTVTVTGLPTTKGWIMKGDGIDLSGSVSSIDISDLHPGTYTVTITDTNDNCSTDLVIVVPESSDCCPPTYTIDCKDGKPIVNLTIYGKGSSCSGSYFIKETGANASFSSCNVSVSNLSEGTYTFTISVDGCGNFNITVVVPKCTSTGGKIILDYTTQAQCNDSHYLTEVYFAGLPSDGWIVRNDKGAIIKEGSQTSITLSELVFGKYFIWDKKETKLFAFPVYGLDESLTARVKVVSPASGVILLTGLLESDTYDVYLWGGDAIDPYVIQNKPSGTITGLAAGAYNVCVVSSKTGCGPALYSVSVK